VFCEECEVGGCKFCSFDHSDHMGLFMRRAKYAICNDWRPAFTLAEYLTKASNSAKLW
jgi:hypothetical protein